MEIMPRAKPFTPNEIRKIRQFAAKGISTTTMAESMKRHKTTIEVEMSKRGIFIDESKNGRERKCSNHTTGCRNTFVSKWAGPCPSCAKSNKGKSLTIFDVSAQVAP